MTAVLINVATVILGSAVGLLLKKGIPEKISKAAMAAIGLCTLYIGIDGALEGENTIVLILSLVFGAVTCTAIDMDRLLDRAGKFLESRVKSKNEKSTLSEGFVTGSLLFCVGAMTIIGSLESGLKGDHTTIITKSILDLFSSCMLSASLGIGVIFAAIFVFVFQGGLVLAAGLLEPLLSGSAVAEITCAGSLMIMALGFNLTGIAKFKVANYFPALVLAPFVCYLFEFLGKYIPALA
jgi:uncharacterized membrane protein YqgA involved in biofilm formation